jgi:hypothetical protein
LFINHLYNLPELLISKYDAIIRKGVVGNPGKKIPNIANPTNRVPKNTYRYLNYVYKEYI